MTDTLEDRTTSRRRHRPEAGVVVVFSLGKPCCKPFPLDGRPLILGRETVGGATIDDPRLSRHHAQVAIGAKGWLVRDLGSRNGTRVDGQPITDQIVCAAPPLLRLGRSIALAVPDVLPFVAALPTRRDDVIVGPTLRATFIEVAAVATADEDLLVVGESGSGKELAAQHYHASGPRAQGPFVAVNCAAIPHGVAERLLFGAVKGAFSGASADATGYVQAAEGGVLFLDELGELDLEVQAKLLRVIETKEVLPVGAARTRRVDTRFVFATNRDLRDAVTLGTFRRDLYYRVGQSMIALPPLRERREEIPWLAQLAVEKSAPGLELKTELVEACMLRPWPGNVRELLGEVRRVARMTRAQSLSSIPREFLGANAGVEVDSESKAAVARKTPVTAEELQSALREADSVSGAAKVLGIHRSHLYRLMRQFGIDPDAVTSE